MHRLIGDADAVFKYIVHTAAQPAFIVCSQQKIQTLLHDCVPRNLGVYIHVKVFVPVSVCMADYNINVIQRCGVTDFKFYLRLKCVASLVIRYTHIFLEDIDSLARRKK